MKEGLGAFHLECGEAALGGVSHFGAEFVFGVAEAVEFVEGEVDAVAGQVFLNVAEDVGELHGEAEVYRVVFGFGVAVAEYLEADEANDGGDAIAVEAEIVEGLVAVVFEVHFDAADDVLEVGLGDVVGLGGVGQGREDGALRLALVGLVEAGGEVKEGGLLGLGGGDFVDGVVAVAAEGIGGVDGAALGGGEGEESVEEVLGLAPGDEAAFLVGVG